MWHGVPFACQQRPIIGVLRMCWLLPGSFDCFCCPHTSVHRPSIACLAVFLRAPGALFLHALSGPSTICPFPPRGWSAPDGLPLLLHKQPIWAAGDTPHLMPVEQGLPWHPVATGLAGQAIPFIVAASHAHALPSVPFWFSVPAVPVASPASLCPSSLLAVPALVPPLSPPPPAGDTPTDHKSQRTCTARHTSSTSNDILFASAYSNSVWTSMNMGSAAALSLDWRTTGLLRSSHTDWVRTPCISSQRETLRFTMRRSLSCTARAEWLHTHVVAFHGRRRSGSVWCRRTIPHRRNAIARGHNTRPAQKLRKKSPLPNGKS